jgi:hypothetical protein
LLREGLEPSGVPVRVGNNWIMNPRASGIAPAGSYRPSAPTTTLKSSTRVLKSRRPGLFSSIVNAPLAGSNFFDK